MPECLLKAYDTSRIGLVSGEGDMPRDETTSKLEADMRDEEDKAARAVLTKRARTEALTLNRLGKKVDVPGGPYDTIADIAAAFVPANSWRV